MLIEKANMYYKYGMLNKAKELYLEIIVGNDVEDKAESYYKLGSLIYEEGNLSLALDTWKDLASQYPDSEYAQIVKDRISVLAEAIGETSSERIQDAIAKIYMENGNFWSKGKTGTLKIDSSWIGNVEAANFWYDKIIEEFPGSNAAETSYISIMKTLLGWKDGPYASYGIVSDYNTYMPQLVSTFNEFENAFPSSSMLQAFRFQIAQTFWRNKDWDNTRLWLNKIIEAAGPSDSFYKDLAERRLTAIEY